MAKKDYYSILGIEQKATQKAIKSAYRQMALKYHPDHNSNTKAADRFKLIREAYDILSDPQTRSNYDSTYKPTTPPRPRTKPNSTGKPSSSVERRKNLRYNVFVTLEESLTGCEKTIRYLRKVKGEQETMQLKVKIPKGAYNQQRLKITNYGEDAGDLFVIVHLQNHPLFQTDGLDVSVNVPISYLQAAEGSVISVPTLSGVRKIKLRSCVFEDIRFTLSGQGLLDQKSGERGKLSIHCFIEHPKKLSVEQKNAVQKVLSSWPQGDMMREYQSYLSQNRRS